jgi:hypothetical protein
MPCPMCEAAEEVIDDIDTDKLREFYMDHASEPYFCESSGVSMTFRNRDFGPSEVSELLASVV